MVSLSDSLTLPLSRSQSLTLSISQSPNPVSLLASSSDTVEAVDDDVEAIVEAIVEAVDDDVEAVDDDVEAVDTLALTICFKLFTTEVREPSDLDSRLDCTLDLSLSFPSLSSL